MAGSARCPACQTRMHPAVAAARLGAHPLCDPGPRVDAALQAKVAAWLPRALAAPGRPPPCPLRVAQRKPAASAGPAGPAAAPAAPDPPGVTQGDTAAALAALAALAGLPRPTGASVRAALRAEPPPGAIACSRGKPLTPADIAALWALHDQLTARARPGLGPWPAGTIGAAASPRREDRW